MSPPATVEPITVPAKVKSPPIISGTLMLKPPELMANEEPELTVTLPAVFKTKAEFAPAKPLAFIIELLVIST